MIADFFFNISSVSGRFNSQIQLSKESAALPCSNKWNCRCGKYLLQLNIHVVGPAPPLLAQPDQVQLWHEVIIHYHSTVPPWTFPPRKELSWSQSKNCGKRDFYDSQGSTLAGYSSFGLTGWHRFRWANLLYNKPLTPSGLNASGPNFKWTTLEIWIHLEGVGGNRWVQARVLA